MGKRGPAPAATEVLEANGTLARNPAKYAGRHAIKSDGCAPTMPDYIAADPHAASKWADLVSDLSTLNVLSSDHRELLISYCVAYSGWRRMLAVVAETGDVLIDRNKKGEATNVRRNAATIELHRYRAQMDRLVVQMGMTPSSRTQLQTVKNETNDDPFAVILQRLTESN